MKRTSKRTSIAINYGPGQELRELADQLADARFNAALAHAVMESALTEISRIERVMAAIAAEQRRQSK